MKLNEFGICIKLIWNWSCHQMRINQTTYRQKKRNSTQPPPLHQVQIRKTALPFTILTSSLEQSAQEDKKHKKQLISKPEFLEKTRGEYEAHWSSSIQYADSSWCRLWIKWYGVDSIVPPPLSGKWDCQPPAEADLGCNEAQRRGSCKVPFGPGQRSERQGEDVCGLLLRCSWLNSQRHKKRDELKWRLCSRLNMKLNFSKPFFLYWNY